MLPNESPKIEKREVLVQPSRNGDAQTVYKIKTSPLKSELVKDNYSSFSFKSIFLHPTYRQERISNPGLALDNPFI